MQHTKNLLIGLILLVLIVSVFLLLRNFRASQHSGPTTGVVISATERITDASASIKYKIDVSYPKFSGLTDKTTEKTINDLLQKQMTDAISSFKQEVDQTEQGLQNAPQQFQTQINELYITYKISRADDKILSIAFSVMDFQAGMDHPNNYNITFNYDVMQKKVLTLTDVFKSDTNYLQELSALSKSQLSARFKENPYAGDFIATGTMPDEKNFQLFTLGTSDLTIIFNPYQVAPYYAGTQDISIPYASLRSVLNPSLSL